MLGLRVYLDDKLVPTETVEDVQDLIDFLKQGLRLREKHRDRIEDYQQQQLPLDFVPGISVRKMSEWLEMAWKQLGSPELGATGDEIFNALEQLGFQSTADDPKAAVKASIRSGRQFIKLASGKNKEAIWGLRDNLLVPSVKPPRFSLGDPRRQTAKAKVVDYAIRALLEMSGKASKEELARLMTGYGWNTKSDDKPGLVAATLRKYQEFEKRGEFWAFSPIYKKQNEDAE